VGYDYDLFVIGAGSGGVRASRMAAAFGARVGICEERYLGGTCVNVGCVPKKLFVFASRYAAEFQDAAGFGWRDVTSAGHDWKTLVANKDREIARLNDIYRGIMERPGVEILEGRGRLVDAHTVDVSGQTVTAENILVCTGGWPFVPDIPGAELAISSNDVFYLEECPKRIVIVGGGYIGVEFATIFAGLGAEVCLIYRGDLFLRGFDWEVRNHLRDEMVRRGIDVRFRTDIRWIQKEEDDGTGAHREHLLVGLDDGDVLDVDQVLMATGRVPQTEGLGLEEVGVTLNHKGAIPVDDFYRTSVPHIFAVGDVIDRVQLTPVALAEGMIVAKHLFGPDKPEPLDYTNIPTAVFTTPELGTVGLTEQDAKDAGHNVAIYRSHFRPMRHTLSGRRTHTLMKLVVCKETDKVLGCHMVGPSAGEIIQGLGVALKCGATKAQFDATIGIHPTAAEEFVTMRTPIS